MIYFIINFINIMNQMIISGTKPVITLYASQTGASPASIGLLVSAFSLLPAFLAVHIGKWIDRYGVKLLVLCGGSALFVSMVLPVLLPYLPVFIISQAILGMAFTIQAVALQKRAGSVKAGMDQRIAMFSLYASLGAMLGPLLGTFLYERSGFAFTYGANALLCLVALGAGVAVSRQTWNEQEAESIGSAEGADSGSVWGMLRQRELRNAVITSGLAISGKEIFAAYFPLMGEQMGMSPSAIGVLLSVMGATAMAVRFSQNRLVLRFGRGHVLTWSLYISGLIYIITPGVSWLAVLAVLIGVLGGSLGLGQPLSLAYAIQASPPERRGEVLGMRITFNRVSQMIIPALFGGIGGAAGLPVIFLASGAMLLVGGFFTRPLPRSASKSDG